ncbi:MAG: bifunctional nuclease family protein [Saprospiraceae bacterium]|nr:bifunctional nuclease family protein [Saprospiraceae bacterium]
MKKIPLEIVALTHNVTQANNFAVLLGEKNGVRRLPIIIGGFEAQAIALAMERLESNRPLTHDLFKNTLDTFGIELREVIISNLLEGIFYARLICNQNGVDTEIDSRTSDALAMAVRYNCPIFTYEFVLDAAGVILEDTESSDETKEKSTSEKTTAVGSTKNSLAQYTIDALNKMLEDVLNEEDYEKAARIRDEINKRKPK